MDDTAQMFTMVRLSLTMLECYREKFPQQNMIIFNVPVTKMVNFV